MSNIPDTAPSQLNNVIKIIRTWKDGPIYVFDDEDADLRHEAFVPNATALIDALKEKYKVKADREGKITLLFSDVPFPDSTKLILVGADVGVTYRWEEKELDAWLCPAFFCYFEPTEIPKELFALVVP